MLFTRPMADAFGDWLEREQIHHALVHARPDLEGLLVLDEDRPLLRIPLTDGTTMLVAKTDAEPGAGWVLGVPHPHTPRLHETGTLSELVRRVLEALDVRSPHAAAARTAR
ncbi:hypothetical protein CFK38_07575 [Brachybacterium vulturis]|uniref:Uncharacterized protein n=1 Tax=Brachybacterium vulturis TaxID=2017484 RepID=A0A291GMV2_9MICO|nr:hypothetical protein [Brachybacterium vulturis]ATG51400.1 hypothetical protein CFK38_07575 [Brachybacterium vulturis]